MISSLPNFAPRPLCGSIPNLFVTCAFYAANPPILRFDKPLGGLPQHGAFVGVRDRRSGDLVDLVQDIVGADLVGEIAGEEKNSGSRRAQSREHFAAEAIENSDWRTPVTVLYQKCDRTKVRVADLGQCRLVAQGIVERGSIAP